MRIMLKISGEALGGGADSADERYDRETILYLVDQIQSLVSNGHEIALTLGGGNLFRGTTFVKELGIKRTTADYVGILGTMQNSLVVRDFLELSGLKTIMSVPFFIPQISESYIPTRLRKKLGGGWTIIFGAGIGVPYFTSDTATIQRALEIEADCIYMIKNGIDGIYDKDPNKEKGAKKYRSITATEILEKKLAFADLSAIEMLRDNNLRAKVMSITDLKHGDDLNTGTEVLPK